MANEAARDYSVPEKVITMPQAILEADERPWVDIGKGIKRKYYFSDRITMVYFEMTKAGQEEDGDRTHAHPHDQIAYILEGQAEITIGDEVKEIGPGGVFIVPSNMLHNLVVLSEKVVAIDVFTPPREDFRQDS